ncbi:permease [bacterium]|nr:permease [bacterium]
MPDSDVILWGIAVRTAQAFIEAPPTIVCGTLVAGDLRRMVGPAGVRRAFGSPGWKGIVKGWVFGKLLPVCSVGVIPVVRELRRAGVPSGTVLVFVLVAPLLNPISFLYGLTLAGPVVILTFAAVSLVLALVVGEVWDRFYPSDPSAAPTAADEPLPAPGLKRLLAVAVEAGREAVGPVMLFCLVAAVGSGLLAVIPFGAPRRACSTRTPRPRSRWRRSPRRRSTSRSTG